MAGQTDATAAHSPAAGNMAAVGAGHTAAVGGMAASAAAAGGMAASAAAHTAAAGGTVAAGHMVAKAAHSSAASPDMRAVPLARFSAGALPGRTAAPAPIRPCVLHPPMI